MRFKAVFAGFFLVLCTTPALAQAVRSYTAKPVPRVPAGKPAPYNATAKDTTPLNCAEQFSKNPNPIFLALCVQHEQNLVQGSARRGGQPVPSSSVVALPALGSPSAKANGFACIGGQAFRKIPNGWEQVHAKGGGWQRCTGG